MTNDKIFCDICGMFKHDDSQSSVDLESSTIDGTEKQSNGEFVTCVAPMLGSGSCVCFIDQDNLLHRINGPAVVGVYYDQFWNHGKFIKCIDKKITEN